MLPAGRAAWFVARRHARGPPGARARAAAAAAPPRARSLGARSSGGGGSPKCHILLKLSYYIYYKGGR